MKKQNVLFNLDDTLVECNKYFKLVIKQFADMLGDWFRDGAISLEQIKQKQVELDLASVSQNGITSLHFPLSFVYTYVYFCELTRTKVDASKVELLERLGKSVYEFAAEPLPDMYETLQELKQEGHELYLHTAGDEAIQRNKIAQLQLAAYFDNRVFISKFKNTTALQHIVEQMQFDPKETWMIGNSLRTDILPALELGVQTIYIPAAVEWQYNVIEINVQPRGAFLTLPSLKEVPETIREYVVQKK
jgi:putative hydrolase of the HAD superfamily